MKKITSLVMTLILLCMMGHVAVAANEPTSLIANGDFTTLTTGWTLTELEHDKDGGYVKAKVDSETGAYNGGSIKYNFIPVEADKTYTLSFRMKSSKKDVATLDGITQGNLFYSTYPANGSYNIPMGRGVGITFGLKDYEGEEIEWRDYSVDIPAPVNAKCMRFQINVGADPAFAIDDIRLEETEKPVNYVMNGDFELGLTGWRTVGTPGELAEDASTGNLYFNRTYNSYSNYIRHDFLLPKGRYKISFKAKSDTNGKVSVSLFGDKAYDSITYPPAEANYCSDFYDGQWAYASNAWKTFNFYVTLEADKQIYLALPTARWGQSSTSAAWYDDVSVTKDETWIDFAEHVRSTDDRSTHSFTEVKTGESLSTLPATGGEIPVTAHFVPTTEGVAQTVTMISAVYKTEQSGTRKLVDVSVKTGTTDVSEATQNGKNAMGILTLSDSVTCPAGADATYTAEVMLWDSLDVLKPYRATKTILTK